MPFGSRTNNFAAMCVAGFIAVSFLSTALGQVLWNTRTLKESLRQQALVIEQQALVIEQNRVVMGQLGEGLDILRRVERRYLLDGKDK